MIFNNRLLKSLDPSLLLNAGSIQINSVGDLIPGAGDHTTVTQKVKKLNKIFQNIQFNLIY